MDVGMDVCMYACMHACMHIHTFLMMSAVTCDHPPIGVSLGLFKVFSGLL